MKWREFDFSLDSSSLLSISLDWPFPRYIEANFIALSGLDFIHLCIQTKVKILRGDGVAVEVEARSDGGGEWGGFGFE